MPPPLPRRLAIAARLAQLLHGGCGVHAMSPPSLRCSRNEYTTTEGLARRVRRICRAHATPPLRPQGLGDASEVDHGLRNLLNAGVGRNGAETQSCSNGAANEDSGSNTAEMSSTPEDIVELEVTRAMGPMEEGDAVFGADSEVTLDSLVYWRHDKYLSRKPKYSNCVFNGSERNKYNPTHYDHDDPPNIVKRYKFHIFYPDLVDKSRRITTVMKLAL
ncbi:hypothetical protein ZIOFF_030301 [Zingiber officinale]|uniref:Splicing factor Cactin C-terminal domain-containing protein n=1 Tax=Zingiber officinale TaxID=94328 RepID=A0A8J5H948_ZINOF|nr:hypothetical protein ZIOFF_030301 [Zingiber officinale]